MKEPFFAASRNIVTRGGHGIRLVDTPSKKSDIPLPMVCPFLRHSPLLTKGIERPKAIIAIPIIHFADMLLSSISISPRYAESPPINI